MRITPIKTDKIIPNSCTLESLLDKYVKNLEKNSVVVISSKIISIIQNRVKSLSDESELTALINEESDFVAKRVNKYGRKITVKFNALISASGIDQSNANGLYILLPKDPRATAHKIYEYLSNKFQHSNFGVIVCDSHSTPLRVGAMGIAIGFWGFSPLKNYIGEKDIFDREFKFERANMVDALASSAVLAMGEGAEQTPIAIIEDTTFLKFDSKKPSKVELQEFYTSLKDDYFHLFYEDLFENKNH